MRHIKIFWKIAATQVVFACAMAVILINSLQMANTLDRNFERVQEGNATLDLMDDAVTDTREAYSHLYALLTWQANSQDAPRIAKLKAAVDDELGNAAGSLQRMAQLPQFGAEDRATIARLADDTRTVRSAAAEVIQFSDVDPPTALLLLGDADQRFQQLKSEIVALAARMKAANGTVMSDAVADSETSVWLTIAILTAAILVGLVIAVVVAYAIVNPVKHITATMRALAGGERTVAIPDETRRDEVGEMARAVAVFKDNMLRADALAAEQEAAQRIELDRARRIKEISGTFDRDVGIMVEDVSGTATELEATAQSMASVAEQTSRQASAVSVAVNQATHNVETVAAAAEQLAASVAEITRQIHDSSVISRTAVGSADRTNHLFEGLTDSASRIGDVVKLITDIAEQINLLALNATIEAARAGSAGKGFAVVAGEVKNLASQTAKATQDIAQQVGTVQSATAEAVAAIREITGIIGRIDEIGSGIAAAMEQQGAATHEIARNAQQAALSTSEVIDHVSGLTHGADEAGSASRQVFAKADAMARQVDLLRTKVDSFLVNVQSA